MGGRRLVSDCMAEKDPQFPRECGNASTYNNAGCRGEACRRAATADRVERRTRAQRSEAVPLFVEPTFTRGGTHGA